MLVGSRHAGRQAGAKVECDDDDADEEEDAMFVERRVDFL